MPSETAQQRFDRTYITSAEISRELGVNRTTVLNAKNRGLLPDAVIVNELLCIWERDTVRPYLDAWKLYRTKRVPGEAQPA
jgi:hypothetical protein